MRKLHQVDVNLFSELKRRLASEIYRKLEEELKCACLWVAGTDDPKLLRGRLRAVLYNNEPYEDYMIDNYLVLRVWPPDFAMHPKMEFSRNIQRYWKALGEGVAKA